MPNTATDMEIVSSIAAARAATDALRREGARVGLVPTMGALHRGHLSLVERCRAEADVTIMSIFVNPLQFGPGEDLSRYPRPVEEDERLARDAGVGILFRPGAAEMYAPERTVTVSAGQLGSRWEGESRPGHFDGVLTVVAKLFNITQPDVAVFGRKDLQQAALVRAMTRDLDMRVDIITAPIVRESDGLAMSSRNRYLSVQERLSATSLSRALETIRRQFRDGQEDVARLEKAGREVLDSDPRITTDYIAVVNPSTFEKPESATGDSAAIVAARVGSTRLIDNMPLGSDDEA